MRSIHYSIRAVVIVALVSLAYAGVAALLHQSMQLPVWLLLLGTVFATERLWALCDWLAPVVGSVNKRQQEREQQRQMEHVLARSLRYGSPLVVAAIREKKRASLHVVAHHLRSTDMVLRSRAGYLLVLMPNTTVEQAAYALGRLTMVQVQDIVMLNEQILCQVMDAELAGSATHQQRLTAKQMRVLCLQTIEETLANVRPSQQAMQSYPIIKVQEQRVLTAVQVA